MSLETSKNKNLEVDENKFYLIKKVKVKDRFNFYEYMATMVDG